MNTNETRYLTDTEIDQQHSGYMVNSITVKRHAGLMFQGKQGQAYHSGEILLEKNGDEIVDNWIQHFRSNMPYIAFDNWFAPAEYEKLSERINQAIVDFNTPQIDGKVGGYNTGVPGSRY